MTATTGRSDRVALARRLALKLAEEAREAYNVTPESQTCGHCVDDLVQLVALLGAGLQPDELTDPHRAADLVALRGGLLRMIREAA